MPLTNVKLIEDVVEQVASADWGIGGKPLSTEDVKALPAGAPA